MRKIFLRVIVFFVVVLLASVGFTGERTVMVVRALRARNFAAASAAANQSLLILTPLSELTLHRIPPLELWRQTLTIIPTSATTFELTQQYLTQAAQLDPQASTTARQLLEQLEVLEQQNTQLRPLITKSWLTTHLLSPQQLHTYELAAQLLPDLRTALTQITQGQHSYIIVLQNSEELRATGGFMGSFARVELDNGAVTNFTVQDIYEPTGQFKGFVEAPPGAKEYLSSGKGWHLPDSNWNPDFPSAAQNILQFFALGKQSNVDGLIAINLSVAEKILTVTGPINLPDYQTEVTAENLASVARADREHFFPGSQQKRDFLRALLTQLKFKLGELSSAQKQELLSTLITQLPQKNIQLFSHQPTLQQVIQKYQLAGAMSTQQLPLNSLHYFFSVESNVGINKANKLVSREVAINASDYLTRIEITWHNQNSAQDYINYHRIYVLPTESVHTIIIDGKPITRWDERLITTANGQSFRELGILVPVAAQHTQQLTLELSHLALPTPTFLIQKQAGLPPTPYTITVDKQQETLLLDQDTVVNFAETK